MAEPGHAPSNKLQVFISYSRDDLAFADQLDAALGLQNFNVVIDLTCPRVFGPEIS